VPTETTPTSSPTTKPARTHRTIWITSTVRVDRPAAEVAAVVLDWSHDPRWRRAVTRLDTVPAGPAVVGQRLVEELVFAGRTYVTPTRVVTAGPLRASYTGGSDAFEVSGSREVVPRGAGCEVRTELLLTPQGFMRLLAPLLAPVYRRSDAADLVSLERLLTAGSAP
jgi:hypothetical protein